MKQGPGERFTLSSSPGPVPRRFLLLLPVLAAILPARGAAQYAATQDATLRGLRTLSLTLNLSAPDLPQDTAAALVAFTREALGKAGVSVVPLEPAARAQPDGILRISLTTTARGRWVDDLGIRFQIEQTATLPRTGDVLSMVTWYAEQNDQNIPATDLTLRARAVLQQVVSRLIKACATGPTDGGGK